MISRPLLDGDRDFDRVAFGRGGEEADLAGSGRAEDGEGAVFVGTVFGRVEAFLGGRVRIAKAKQDAEAIGRNAARLALGLPAADTTPELARVIVRQSA